MGINKLNNFNYKMATKEIPADKIAAHLGVSAQHQDDIDSIMQYFEKNKINELFNEIITTMLHKRPMEDPKQYVLETLKSIQVMSERERKSDDPLNKNIYRFMKPFLTREDFEAMFDAYDVLDVRAVPLKFLEHAMEQVGVKCPQDVIKQRYAELY